MSMYGALDEFIHTLAVTPDAEIGRWVGVLLIGAVLVAVIVAGIAVWLT